jgi:acyl-CoA thioesterase
MDTKELLAADKFALNAGIILTHLSPGYAKAQMEITPAHLNGGGVCQGGAIFTLADFAVAAAANSHGILSFSVFSTVNFFRSDSPIARSVSPTSQAISSPPSPVCLTASLDSPLL